MSEKQRRQLSIDDYVKGVLEGNRTILARAITLVESNSPVHLDTAQDVLKQLLPYTERSAQPRSSTTNQTIFGRIACASAPPESNSHKSIAIHEPRTIHPGRGAAIGCSNSHALSCLATSRAYIFAGLA